MKRIAAGISPALLILLLAHGAEAGGAEFVPALNGLRVSPGALHTYDFESAEGLVGAELATWAPSSQGGYGYPKLQRAKIASADQVASLLTTAADAIEGAHAFRIDGSGLAITDQALFAKVKDGRFEASIWARGDGAAPAMQVLYDRDAENIYGGRPQFALVRAIRTGRETTDGWAEYSTGPVDGSVWDVPARAIVILPPYNYSGTSTTAAKKDAAFLVDAFEIRAVDGKPTVPNACTQANVDTTCGPEGDCMFGHCISSTITWGANPPAGHRAEIAERWVQFGTRFMGDRNAASNGKTILAPQARELAKTAPSSRQFFGGLNRLVNLLRDNHTSFGAASNLSSFAPQVQQGSSSVMGACFGVVEKDVMGGGLGFAVFRASNAPTTGVKLKTGDVITQIDGIDPKAWVDDVWPRFATTLPNDPLSDWGAVAGDLSTLITARASTVTLERCASSTSCEPAAREKITIDMSSVVYKALTSPTGSSSSSSGRFGCSQRFSESVDANEGGGFGEDAVLTVKGTGGETRVQFDGFVGQKAWETSMTNVFSSGASHVLMDARMGHGGYYSTVEHLFHLLRGTNEPMGVFSVGRGSYDMSDPPWLFNRFGTCTNQNGGNMWGCLAGNANGFFASEAAPPGATTKIAWLNTRDVSANDFMPRLLKGRTGFKIFAPHPTSGAFGAVLSLPAVASGWSGGSIQIQDARFAPSMEAAEEARWESGHGVEPDVVVAQKLSDALAGVDTIVKTATAWLAE